MTTARLISPVTYADFAPYLLSNTPALLPPSATEDWPAYKLWFNQDRTVNYNYLRAQYGQLNVQAVDCGSWEAEQREFGDVLDDWERGVGEGVYVKEWEECVGDLLERSAGWNWATFWSMIRLALQSLDPERSPAQSGGWPTTPASARPQIAFIMSQVTPLFEGFHLRVENERKWTRGLGEVLNDVKVELEKLKAGKL
ncbi:hypothetical protein P7C70_g5713, partial [Phenoliferia sp. Uapishka_3]